MKRPSTARAPRGVLRGLYSNAGLVVLFIVILGFLTIAAGTVASMMTVEDFAQYWAAAHLARSNPYSHDDVRALEVSAGYSAGLEPLIMRNPPWALPFVLPFSGVSYRTGFAIWLLFSFVTIAACGRICWNLVSPAPSLAPAFLSLLFGPTVFHLALGQLTVIVLLGLTMFLWGVKWGRWWVSGVGLFMMSIKPHIVLLFLIAMFLWIILKRRWTIILAGCCCLALSSGLMLALNYSVFQQYLEFVHKFTAENVSYCNFGGLLYRLSNIKPLAVLPEIAGIAWLLWYWRRNRHEWNWFTHGMTVLVTSMAVTYYSYSYDEIIVIPALIAAYATGNRKTFLVGFCIGNLGYVLFFKHVPSKFGLDYMFLAWTGVCWLLTYGFSRYGWVWGHEAHAAEVPES